ncbi:uncharacterized protein LOC132278205 [Cornus florida]|uniref:uncharacterized protein LOC132278205 n=1 Tax=Cornus florida TaxID=4283 RepID=UPI0028A0635A|nr:uncharacterized protein LOC132278205 [Cornus florida]
MELIMAEKLQAMKNYKKDQFVNKLILHFFTALICTLFCTYPFWFPQVKILINDFVFVSIPNFKSFLFNPKCLFIVGNAIVVILVVESKLASGSHSSSATNIYDEYVERSQSLQGAASKHKENKEERKEDIGLTQESSSSTVNKIEEEVKAVVYIEEEKRETGGKKDADNDSAAADDNDHKEEVEEEKFEEEEPGLPTEELNKRVEEFIAKVNRQRRLEEKGLLVYG